MFSGGLSTKLAADIPRRAIWAREHGVVVGTAADQSAALDAIVNNLMKPSGGRDLGACRLPPGEIRIDTKWSIISARNLTFSGTGCGRTNQNPRTHNGVTVGGTSLYWGGAAGGGPVVDIQLSTDIAMRDFSVYLGRTGANKAATGIHIHNAEATNTGRLYLEKVNIGIASNTERTGTGLLIGDPGNTNCDNSVVRHCEFFNLVTGIHIRGPQARDWHFRDILAVNVETLFRWEQAGAFVADGVNIVWDQLAGLDDKAICTVENSSMNTGAFALRNLSFDRQGTGQFVSLFDQFLGTINTVCVADRCHVNGMTGGGELYDGTERAFFEMGPGHQQMAKDCTLLHQSIVRWKQNIISGSCDDGDKAAVCVVEGGIVPHNRSYGAELVTTASGGYSGQVYFKNVRDDHTFARIRTVSVNVFPLPGNRMTHEDTDNFDALDDGVWANSWLGGGIASSPAWVPELVAYYRMDEAEGAVTLVELVNHSVTPALDLTIESTQQEEGAPLPYLERWCNWGDQATGFGRDTGITIDTAGTNLTLFGIMMSNAGVTGQCVAEVNGSIGDFQFFRDVDSFLFLKHGRSPSFLTAENFSVPNGGILRSPCSFVVTINAETNLTRTFVNGIQVSEGTSNYNGSGTGNIFIGGRNNAGRWNGKLSRVGVILKELSAKEATILSQVMTVVGQRQRFVPTVA